MANADYSVFAQSSLRSGSHHRYVGGIHRRLCEALVPLDRADGITEIVAHAIITLGQRGILDRATLTKMVLEEFSPKARPLSAAGLAILGTVDPRAAHTCGGAGAFLVGGPFCSDGCPF